MTPAGAIEAALARANAQYYTEHIMRIDIDRMGKLGRLPEPDRVDVLAAGLLARIGR